MMRPPFEKKGRLNLLLRTGEVKRKRRRFILVASLLLVVASSVYVFIPFDRTRGPSDLSVPPSHPQAERLQPPSPPHEIVEGKIEAGSSLSKSLARRKVPDSWIQLIVSELKPYIDFRRMKGGTYQLVKGEDGELVKFVYEESPTEVYEIERDGQGYKGQKKEIPLELYLVQVTGEIRSSLFEAMEDVGEKDPLTLSFAEILAWEIDFYKDVKEGDRFKILVEKLYKRDEFIRYGRIHGVEYQSGSRRVRGIEYKGQFYHEDGSSLRRAFLKSPLRFNRISSTFSRARRHPILGGTFPHYGVDYAAPAGTPVWAVADGVVVACGWSGGFGKQIVLRHKNGYTTYYGHLSRFGSGVRLGSRVKQKQIIGYVGSTGLSTGPHLDYRLAKDGRFRNPLREIFPSGPPIGKMEMEPFGKRRDEVVAWLEGEAPLAPMVPYAASERDRPPERETRRF